MGKIAKPTAAIAALLFLCFAAPLFGQNRHYPESPMGRALCYDYKNYSKIHTLLEEGTDPNGIFDIETGQTYFLKAVESCSTEIIQLFLDYGADLFTQDSRGRNAVYYVYDYGIPKKLDYLVSLGIRLDTTDNNGVSPLMYHTRRALLGEAIYIINWEEKNCPQFTSGFESRKEYYTALLVRLMSGRTSIGSDEKLSMVTRLLNGGADANALDADGFPLLFKASVFSEGMIIRLLVERGAPLNEYDKNGQAIIFIAIEKDTSDSRALVDFLLLHGADPNQRDSAGKTPLMIEYSHEAEALGAVLIKHGADPNLQDNEGKTALMYSRQKKYIRFLLQSGADLAIKDNEGKTLLHHRYPLTQLDMQLLEELISKGFNIDEPDVNGVSPLMAAVQVIEYDAIFALLEKGADPVRMDNQGNSALSYAIFYSAKFPNLKPACDLMMESASADDIKAAKTASRKFAAEKRAATADERRGEFFGYAYHTVGILLPPLLYSGLSIGMREGVFANNPASNFMGPLNGMMAMGAGGMLIGGLLGSFSGDWLMAIIGGGLGIVGGIIAASMPQVFSSINTDPLLYYCTTVASAITINLILVRFRGW